ncbi:hypothetical protein PSAC2689_60338 [Paraburkholderia sacchari]
MRLEFRYGAPRMGPIDHIRCYGDRPPVADRSLSAIDLPGKTIRISRPSSSYSNEG